MRCKWLVSGLLIFAAGLSAQDPEPFFPKPAYFKRHFGTVSPKVELQSPKPLGDFAISGKLELSLKDYLQLVMSNNPDISIQVVSVEIQKDAITRAFAIFDPLVRAGFSATRQETPSRNALHGAAALNTLNQPFNLSYQQMLSTGTSYNVQFGNVRLSTN